MNYLRIIGLIAYPLFFLALMSQSPIILVPISIICIISGMLIYYKNESVTKYIVGLYVEKKLRYDQRMQAAHSPMGKVWVHISSDTRHLYGDYSYVSYHVKRKAVLLVLLGVALISIGS